MTALKKTYQAIGFSRLIIMLFLAVLLTALFVMQLDPTTVLTDSLVRIGLNGFFVLAMLPMLDAGVGLNFALPLGILCGQVAGILSVEWKMTGMTGILVACVVGAVIALPVGYGYSLLLNKLRGSEMMVGTYLNFSIVSLACIGWILLPFFTDTRITWAMGKGVRNTIVLTDVYDRTLNQVLSFEVMGVTIPLGLFLFLGVGCLFFWLLQKSKAGMMMNASGLNPMFGKSIGINNDRTRTMGIMFSTICGAIGIVIYSQGIGMYQLYTAPRNMAFPAIAAILIGGATLKKAKISHVIIGTVLYQTILTVAPTVFAQILSDGSSLSEIARVIISNGVILYALTKLGGRKL